MKRLLICFMLIAAHQVTHAQTTESVNPGTEETPRPLTQIPKSDLLSYADGLKTAIQANRMDDAQNRFQQLLALMYTDIRYTQGKLEDNKQKKLQASIKEKQQIYERVVSYQLDLAKNMDAIDATLKEYAKTIF